MKITMKFAQRRPITFYLLATFVITYPLGVASFFFFRFIQNKLGTNLHGVNDMVLKFGPALGGVLTIGLAEGAPGLRDFFRRLVRLHFPMPLFLGAIAIQPVILLAVLYLRGYGPEVQSIKPGAWVGIFCFQLLLNVFLGGGFGEEPGWRGFMLPQLCRRYQPLAAGLLVGMAWLAWHLPAYMFLGKGTSDPLLPFAVILFPFSIVLTWAYFQSKESILLPALLHGSINASFYTLEYLLPKVTDSPGFQPAFDWTVAAVWCLLAGIVVAKWRWSLGKQPPLESDAQAV